MIFKLSDAEQNPDLSVRIYSVYHDDSATPEYGPLTPQIRCDFHTPDLGELHP